MQQRLWTSLRGMFLVCAVSCFSLAGDAEPASQAVKDPHWIPQGIKPGAILNINDSAKFAELGCNSVSFGSDPSLGDYCIGRQMSQGCRGRWSLILERIDWANRRFVYVHHVLDTRNGDVPIGGGKRIQNAYDAQIMAWGNETWVAFECTGDGINRAASCMGPLKDDLTLDTARTNVIIQGSDDQQYHYSASVPKLLAYKHRAYIYWDRLKWRWTDHKRVSTTAWGTEIKEGADGKFWAMGSASRSMASNDPRAVEVFGVDPSDPSSNGIADLFETITDGQTIYMTGARGGSDCRGPGGSAQGCYRLTIGRTIDPLAYHTFNRNLVPDEYMPISSTEYYRFVYRREDDKTVLLGGMMRNPRNIPGGQT